MSPALAMMLFQSLEPGWTQVAIMPTPDGKWYAFDCNVPVYVH